MLLGSPLLVHFSLQTYPRCENSARLASTQECVSESYDCRDECRNLGGIGTLNAQLGWCDCEQIVDPRSLCTGSCLSCRPTTSLERVDGQFVVTVTSCENVEIYREPFLDMYSFGSDFSNPQNVQLVSFSSDGSVLGSLLFDDQETINRLNELTQYSANKRRKRDLENMDTVSSRLRRQSGSESNPLPQTIPNPLICLEVGEAVVFEVSEDVSSSLVHYPVYIKEHLLNSNPGFDYGAFRQLATFIQSGVNISSFVHAFSEPGTYYFSDSITSSNQMAVTVVQDGTTCERGGDEFRVLPSSSSYIVQYGIVSQQVVSQEPDFPAIFGIMAASLFVIFIFMLGILIWRPKSAGLIIPDLLKPIYRRLNEPQIVYVSNCKDLDTLEKSEARLGLSSLVQSTECSSELENFNVKTFYDKLEDQTLHVSAQLARQQADLVRFYDQILQQTESLKMLVSESSVMETVEKNKYYQKRLSLSDKIYREVTETASNPHHQQLSSKKSELMAILKELMTKVKTQTTQNDKLVLQKYVFPHSIQEQAIVTDLNETTRKMESMVSANGKGLSSCHWW